MFGDLLNEGSYFKNRRINMPNLGSNTSSAWEDINSDGVDDIILGSNYLFIYPSDPPFIPIDSFPTSISLYTTRRFKW